MIVWSGGRLLLKDVVTRRTARADPDVVALLDVFDRPRSVAAALRRLPLYRPETVRRAVGVYRKAGLLLRETEAKRRLDRPGFWNGNLASAFYHAATRDIRYIQDPAGTEVYLRTRLAAGERPRRFKRHAGRRLLSLPAGAAGAGDVACLERVLSARRSVRQFRTQPVAAEVLGTLLHGVWGQTGWLDGGVLGRLPTRTSPSGGAMHPIECYLLAWNVRGLPAGIYHYDVPSNGLRRLKAGSPRRAAIRAASGQQWVGEAAFLCVMTAVFERTLWKYRLENAYRTVWYEAGHFGQTFALLATAHGLGAFTTAAMQDSFIERLLGLDGVKEFPVYLVGAGVPDPARRFPKWTAIGKRKGKS